MVIFWKQEFHLFELAPTCNVQLAIVRSSNCIEVERTFSQIICNVQVGLCVQWVTKLYVVDNSSNALEIQTWQYHEGHTIMWPTYSSNYASLLPAYILGSHLEVKLSLGTTTYKHANPTCSTCWCFVCLFVVLCFPLVGKARPITNIIAKLTNTTCRSFAIWILLSSMIVGKGYNSKVCLICEVGC